MATNTEDANFTSTLDEASKKKAREELNELNDSDRALAVQTLRKWIQDQDYIRSPTDFGFLLRYLRTRKFSQLGARETLENYWTIKTTASDWYKNVDPNEPLVLDLLKSGFLISPKVYDSKGRRLIIDRPGRIDMDKIKKSDNGVNSVFKANGIICDWITSDENVQVNGVCVIVDVSDATFSSSLTMWTAENGKTLMKFYMRSLPMRIKEVHFYNEPSFFDAVFGLMKPLFTQKTRDRTHMEGNSMVGIYKNIDKCIIPDEYLPDDYKGPRVGPVSKIVDDMVEEITHPDFVSYIKRLSSDAYGVDLSKQKNHRDGPVEYFRKLNVE